jgi:hypothetical protein
MSVLFARHSPTPKYVRSPGAAAICGALMIVLLVGLAGTSRARSVATCKRGERRSAGHHCKRTRGGEAVTLRKQLRKKKSKVKRKQVSRGAVGPPVGSLKAIDLSLPPTSGQQLFATAPVEGPPDMDPPPPGGLPTEAPTVEVPPVETPPVEAPPVEVPPVETPPVEIPPVEIPPVEIPPVEVPPVETPLVEKGFRFFSSTSFWNEAVPADATLDPSSASVVAALDEQELSEQSGVHRPAINTTGWSVPIYTVPADQPLVRVALVNNSSAALQAAWNAVPLPADAHPAAGTDEHLVVWQPSTDRMWEFWRLEKIGDDWRASWGGAMQEVTAGKGVYGAGSWAGASTSWGATASSLPLVGGLITLEDLKRGTIEHALAISVPSVRMDSYASPAQRTDGGSSAPFSLPEGAHLRLDPSLNLAALHLPRMTLLMAEAAQRYGIFVRDTASNIAFYGQDPTPTGSNPYTGQHGYFDGQVTSSLLAAFPWSHLQLLKMELHAVR